MATTILVCDDEELIRWSVGQHLNNEGFHVVEAADGVAALKQCEEHAPAVMLLDLTMPEKDGLEVLRTLRGAGNEVPVVILTARGDVESAIEATQLGAASYLSKPFDVREVSLAIEDALRQERLRTEVHYLRRREREGYGSFIGKSKTLEPVFRTLRKLEDVTAPTVLIGGESGTGKDVLARAIHSRGPRRRKPFMEVDCAALPEQLIESELFGHERGAFTDAHTLKQGLFEVADGGVVFLDEIGELALGTQAKLLRVLENRTFRRVGGTRSLSMDVALIAATNRDLKAEVAAGNFREDLYYRLSVVPLVIPPLRNRADDIPALVDHFLQHFADRFGRDVQGVAGDAMALLQSYSWPGNVRELRNVLERIVILGPDELIGMRDLPPEIRFAQPQSTGSAPGAPEFVLPENGCDLEAVERSLIAQAMARTDGNQSGAARLLGVSRYALRYRIDKYGLSVGGGGS